VGLCAWSGSTASAAPRPHASPDRPGAHACTASMRRYGCNNMRPRRDTPGPHRRATLLRLTRHRPECARSGGGLPVQSTAPAPAPTPADDAYLPRRQQRRGCVPARARLHERRRVALEGALVAQQAAPPAPLPGGPRRRSGGRAATEPVRGGLSPPLVSFVPLPGEALGRRVGAGRVAVGPAGRRGLLFCRPGAGARTLCHTRLEHGDVDHASGERPGCETAVSELRSSLGAAGCSTGKPSFREAGLPHQKAATARALKRQQRGFCSSLKIP
jgi:hypothetical protein